MFEIAKTVALKKTCRDFSIDASIYAYVGVCTLPVVEKSSLTITHSSEDVCYLINSMVYEYYTNIVYE